MYYSDNSSPIFIIAFNYNFGTFACYKLNNTQRIVLAYIVTREFQLIAGPVNSRSHLCKYSMLNYGRFQVRPKTEKMVISCEEFADLLLYIGKMYPNLPMADQKGLLAIHIQAGIFLGPTSV